MDDDKARDLPTEAEFNSIIESVMEFSNSPLETYLKAKALCTLTVEDRQVLARMAKRVNSILIDAEKKGLNPPDVSEYVQKKLLDK